MFAVVHTGGNQERVEIGDYLRIPHRAGKVGDELTFDKLLLLKDDSGIRSGADKLAGTSVKAIIVRQDNKDLDVRETPLMGKKILIIKRKRRKKYRRKIGFRALFTQVRITEINA
jgi:large subunit ribosomal protein L21